MKEYLLERKLMEQAPDLHRQMRDNAATLNRTLESFFSWFPDFTDHSSLHSMDVLDYSNHILAEQVDELSVAECYVLIMCCYLHDVGMGISKKDYEIFSKELGLSEYHKEHPEYSDTDMIRRFHHEYSGAFIKKYAGIFDIPSEELLFAIIQVSRGHRKTDLFDEKEYPDIETENGVVRTALLSAILRLADEIDMGADRNPKMLFDTSSLTKQIDIDSFALHDSIRSVEVKKDRIVLSVKPTEDRIVPMIKAVAEKMQETLDYCKEVVESRSDLNLTQEKIAIDMLDNIRIPLGEKISSTNAKEVCAQIEKIIAENPGKEPVFDAEKLEYISSAGLRILMYIREGFDKDLIVDNVSRDVYDIFEMTGFSELFDVRRKMREISVDGCEVLGKGYFGTVYRLDEDTVVKVYNSEDAIDMIKNEQRLSKAAFLKGVPTAIAFNIVKVGDKYGSMFELLAASTCTEYLKNSLDDADRIIGNYAGLLKRLHSTEMDKGSCPSVKQRFLDYLETVRKTLPKEKFDRFRKLIEEVPESRNAVHGDCHMNNIMIVEDEMMLIDMDTLAVGNAAFDLAAVFFNYKTFEEDEPGNTERILGITAEMADHIWNETIRVYFENKDEAELDEIKNRIMLLGWLQFLYRMQTDFAGRPLSDIRSAHSVEHINELLDKVDKLAV